MYLKLYYAAKITFYIFAYNYGLKIDKRAASYIEMKRLLTALLLASLLLCGCSDYKKLEIRGYNIAQMDAPTFDKGKLKTRMVLALDMSNPTSDTFVLKDLKATVHKGTENVFLTAVSSSTASLSPKSVDKVEIPLDVTINNPLAAVLSMNALTEMTADIDMRIKKGFLTSHIVKKNIPIKELLDMVQKSGSAANDNK